MAKGNQSAIRNANDAESELIAMIGGSLLIAVILLGTLWFVGSNRIVYFTAPMFRACAWLWNLWPGGEETWGRVNFLYDNARAHARDVSLLEYLYFTNMALTPLAYIFVAVMVALTGWTFTRGSNKMARKINPAVLSGILSNTFTGIIPVMHLGPKLIRRELPGWRPQTWPEEVLLNHKIDGKPLILDGNVNLALVRKYFQGEVRLLKDKNGNEIHRRFSRSLGIQLVDLARDRGKKVCYPDRMSPEGKVMYALLVSYAFGAKEGKADYKKAMDALNRSCAMHPEGKPNLTVAQWLYDKYRAAPATLPTAEAAGKAAKTSESGGQSEAAASAALKAHQLFAVHHWEYTYLFALFAMAKRQGKVTHRQWLWLKPTNRTLFYVLNTVLRKVPHTESAAVWTQHDLERHAAKLKRIPVGEDGTPFINTTPPEEALAEAWQHYKVGLDDDEDAWWADGEAWRRANNLVLDAPPLPPAEMLREQNQDHRFDDEAARLRAESEARFNTKSEEAASRVMGRGETVDDYTRIVRGAAGAAAGAGGNE